MDPIIHLKVINSFFDSEKYNSFPFFEERVFHLLSVTSILRDPKYFESLHDKFKQLIQRNYNAETFRIETFYIILLLLNRHKESFPSEFSIDYDELLKSAKKVLLSNTPTYISEFKWINNFVTHLDVDLNDKEINLLKFRLNLILNEGIRVDDDFEISTYDPDLDCFNTIGYSIEDLEDLEKDMTEASPLFADCLKIELVSVRGKIKDYYDSLDENEDDEDKIKIVDDKKDISNFQSENELDTLFESLRDK